MTVFNFRNAATPNVMSTMGDEFSIANFSQSMIRSGNYVPMNEVYHNSDLFSIISTLSGDLATSRLIANKPQIQSFLNSPSSTSNGHAFWQSMYAQLLIAGESFAYMWRNSNGMVQRLEYLRPSQVNTFLLADGSGLVYTITFDEPELGMKEYEPQGNVIHLRWLSKNGGMTGISPLESLPDELQIKQKSNELTLHALMQSVMAPGILKVNKGGLLNANEKASRSKQFMQQVNKSDSGPIVIDDLEDYSQLEIKSDVSKLLSSTDWTSKQFAKVYGIPDSYLNGQGDQQSSLTMIQGMYSNALNRFMQSILSELNNKFMATDISANLRLATDATGDEFAKQIGAMVTSKTLSSDQAAWLLTRNGYLPEDMPEAKPAPIPQQIVLQPAEKGGEENGNNSNSD